MARERKCSITKCGKAAFASCMWKLRDRVVDEATGKVTDKYHGSTCGLLLCGDHVRNGSDGTPRCLWHAEREKREAAA